MIKFQTSTDQSQQVTSHMAGFITAMPRPQYQLSILVTSHKFNTEKGRVILIRSWTISPFPKAYLSIQGWRGGWRCGDGGLQRELRSLPGRKDRSVPVPPNIPAETVARREYQGEYEHPRKSLKGQTESNRSKKVKEIQVTMASLGSNSKRTSVITEILGHSNTGTGSGLSLKVNVGLALAYLWRTMCWLVFLVLSQLDKG